MIAMKNPKTGATIETHDFEQTKRAILARAGWVEVEQADKSTGVPAPPTASETSKVKRKRATT